MSQLKLLNTNSGNSEDRPCPLCSPTRGHSSMCSRAPERPSTLQPAGTLSDIRVCTAVFSVDCAAPQSTLYDCVGCPLGKVPLRGVSGLKFSPCSACQAMCPGGEALGHPSSTVWYYWCPYLSPLSDWVLLGTPRSESSLCPSTGPRGQQEVLGRGVPRAQCRVLERGAT